MDHNCDSFYNSQQRISRFPGLVWSGDVSELEGEVGQPDAVGDDEGFEKGEGLVY